MKNRAYTFSAFTLPLSIVILLFCQFLFSNGLAAVGAEIHDIDTEIGIISEENDYLRQQLAVAQSLDVIEEKARELGFTTPTQFVTLPASIPVALR